MNGTVDYITIMFYLFILSIPFVLGFIVWITKTLNKQNLALAVLVSETRPALKIVNEVIDLKLASAVINETLIKNTANIDKIFTTLDHYNVQLMKNGKI